MAQWTLHRGDCRDSMRTMDAESIDAIVCDPPYGLSFMGRGWDHGVPGVEFWEAALRVAKPGCHLLAFGGTRTFHRLTVAIEDAGWEIRDCVMWVYGSGFPKSHDVSKAIDKAAGAEREVVGPNPWNHVRNHNPEAWQGSTRTAQGKYGSTGSGLSDITAPATDAALQWSGWGTALKPAWEPVIVARKPLSGNVAENVLRHGTGGINVDGCRIEGIPPSVPQPVFNSPTGRTYGMKTGEGRNGEMSHASGRWPANVIHDNSDEVVGLMGDAARFFYVPKASKSDRDEGCEGLAEREPKHAYGAGLNTATKLVTDEQLETGQVSRENRRNHHPTVKPTALMRYLCRLVTPPGGIILDPFAGSGSTGKAAILEGYRAVLCELTPDYWPIIEARCAAACKAAGVVEQVEPRPSKKPVQRRLFGE